MQQLAETDGVIRIGPSGPQQVILDCSPVSFNVDRRIDEEKLETLGEVADDVPAEDVSIVDDENGVEEGEAGDAE